MKHNAVLQLLRMLLNHVTLSRGQEIGKQCNKTMLIDDERIKTIVREEGISKNIK